MDWGKSGWGEPDDWTEAERAAWYARQRERKERAKRGQEGAAPATDGQRRGEMP